MYLSDYLPDKDSKLSPSLRIEDLKTKVPSHVRARVDNAVVMVGAPIGLAKKMPGWLMAVLLLALHGAFITLLYFFSVALANPYVPHTLNRTVTVLKVTYGFLILWTVVLVVTDLAVLALNLIPTIDRCRAWMPNTNRGLRVFITFGVIFVMLGVLSLLGWIWWFIIPQALVQKAFVAGCDANAFPITSLITVNKISSTGNNVDGYASFYMTATSSPLFTYKLTSSDSLDLMTFALKSIDDPSPTIPSSLYPTVQQVTFNLSDHSLVGTCTHPVTDSTTIYPNVTCLGGTYDLSHKTFGMHILGFSEANSPSIFINSTVGSASGEWFTQTPPRLRLHGPVTSDGTALPAQAQLFQSGGGAKDVILQTVGTQGQDCAVMKVCVAGVAGRDNGKVAPEVILPMAAITRMLASTRSHGCWTSGSLHEGSAMS